MQAGCLAAQPPASVRMRLQPPVHVIMVACGCMLLQPPAHVICSCSLRHVRLQPAAHAVAAGATYGCRRSGCSAWWRTWSGIRPPAKSAARQRRAASRWVARSWRGRHVCLLPALYYGHTYYGAIMARQVATVSTPKRRHAGEYSLTSILMVWQDEWWNSNPAPNPNPNRNSNLAG